VIRPILEFPVFSRVFPRSISLVEWQIPS